MAVKQALLNFWHFTRSALALPLFAAALAVIYLNLSACASSQQKPKPTLTTVMPVNTGKPTIKRLLDLGPVQLIEGMTEITTSGSDELFVPAEWVLLEGKNIAASEVLVDNKKVPVHFYLSSNQMYLKVPTGLNPRDKHTLVVNTQFGEVTTEFYSSHYFLANDLDGKQVLFLRTSQSDKGVDEDWQSLGGDYKRPMFALVAKDSRYAFVVDIVDDAEAVHSDLHSFQLRLDTYDLTAPKNPSRVASKDFVLGSALSDAVLNNTGQLLLLGKQSFALLDVSDPLNIEFLGRNPLPINGSDSRTAYVDAIFLNDDNQFAVLETYSNTVSVFQNNGGQSFPLIVQQNILPEKSIPLSVDLEPDPKNDKAFWVLQSPNFRLTGNKFNAVYRKLFNKEKLSADKATLAQLVKYELNGEKLDKQSVIELEPGSVGYFIAPSQSGTLLVSMSRASIVDIDFADLTKTEALKTVKDLLWGTIAFGKIAEVNTETKNVSQFLRGVGIYYHLLDAPGYGPVFSLIKLGPSFGFPYLVPTWGVGINGVGTYSLRKMNRYAFFPPYSIGHMAFQY